ncbi:MAG: bifunctional DNA-formamidopyrimidine glycosylase/DNA-(apurinic or apyrimidinic site) lyase [Firmicutes bacterium]|nr:bifunctional DNA-formamidopyrimidine glycosylase/DNA-(apurinic or apyrimidinic site) lyase [Bacillota bacterium]
MPELPEVETVKRSLEKLIVGLTIAKVDILMPKIIKSHTPDQFQQLIAGRKVISLERRGKYLQIHLSGTYTLIIHLRMTGRLVLITGSKKLPKYTHVIFHLEKDKRLVFADMRQFGTINLVPDEELQNMPGLKDLGPEPLGNDFSLGYLEKELQRRRTRVKTLLLNQSFVAGLGNIYADEALHLAKIHPERLANELSQQEVINLHQAIIEVIKQGIENRGTSFSDYVDGEGNIGSNQNMLKAYQRAGEPCHCCGTNMERKKVTGRSSCYCPQCQRL